MEIICNNFSLENKCENIFASEPSMLKESFTRLWTQVICEEESGVVGKKDMQTNHLSL